MELRFSVCFSLLFVTSLISGPASGQGEVAARSIAPVIGPLFKFACGAAAKSQAQRA